MSIQQQSSYKLAVLKSIFYSVNLRLFFCSCGKKHWKDGNICLLLLFSGCHFFVFSYNVTSFIVYGPDITFYVWARVRCESGFFNVVKFSSAVPFFLLCFWYWDHAISLVWWLKLYPPDLYTSWIWVLLRLSLCLRWFLLLLAFQLMFLTLGLFIG